MQIFMNIYANYDPIIVRCPGKVKRERALQFQLGFAAAASVGVSFTPRLWNMNRAAMLNLSWYLSP